VSAAPPAPVWWDPLPDRRSALALIPWPGRRGLPAPEVDDLLVERLGARFTDSGTRSWQGRNCSTGGQLRVGAGPQGEGQP
jgi:hypothetical protein